MHFMHFKVIYYKVLEVFCGGDGFPHWGNRLKHRHLSLTDFKCDFSSCKSAWDRKVVSGNDHLSLLCLCGGSWGSAVISRFDVSCGAKKISLL